jgi:hypothetical protein
MSVAREKDMETSTVCEKDICELLSPLSSLQYCLPVAYVLVPWLQVLRILSGHAVHLRMCYFPLRARMRVWHVLYRDKWTVWHAL